MTTHDLGIIEVPPELRGLSDEEILKLNDVRAKKSRSSSRPSKKERLQKKQANLVGLLFRIKKRNKLLRSHFFVNDFIKPFDSVH